MPDPGGIKLAKAMGWTQTHRGRWKDPYGLGMLCENPPNPFTDANDDFAVLEWMRKEQYGADGGPTKLWLEFSLATFAGAWTWYKVGDYARIAVMALEKVSSTESVTVTNETR